MTLKTGDMTFYKSVYFLAEMQIGSEHGVNPQSEADDEGNVLAAQMRCKTFDEADTKPTRQPSPHRQTQKCTASSLGCSRYCLPGAARHDGRASAGHDARDIWCAGHAN